MENKTLVISFMPVAILFVFGLLRAFFRAGLKGELIRAIGILIILIYFFIQKNFLIIIGLIIFNIGWLILVTFENNKRQEIYKSTTAFDRLIGNVPIINKKEFPKTYEKKTGVIIGIMCLLLSFIRVVTLKNIDSFEITFWGILAFGGIFLVVFSLFSKPKIK